MARIEGFGQIIVGADLEADDSVHFLALGRQHQHRQRRGRAQLPAQRQTVLAGQHEIENDEIDAPFSERLGHLDSVAGAGDAKAVLGEKARQQLTDFPVVVDHQKMGHRASG